MSWKPTNEFRYLRRICPYVYKEGENPALQQKWERTIETGRSGFEYETYWRDVPTVTEESK